MDDDIFEQFKGCPSCDARGKDLTIFLVREHSDRAMYHLECKKCNSTFFLFVTQGQFGIMSVGVITDVSREEARSLQTDDIVDVNHVIDMHDFLKEYKGPSTSLFRSL